jgi:putative transposase
MTNHVHLLVTPKEKGAASAMLQDLGRKYVRVINTVHGRTGTLWEGRYKSSLVDGESYLLACHRYIESNPVRAGMVREPAGYPWSSHGHYALGIVNPLLTDHEVYRALGETQAERQAAFRALALSVLDDKTIDIIRKSTNAGVVLGSDAFAQRIADQIGRNVRLPARGRPPKADCIDGSGDSPVFGKLL